VRLTSVNIVHYLLERRLVDPESVVDGDFMVVEVPRRNCNFRVLRNRPPGYFVKQIQEWAPQSVAALEREAACYWLCAHHPDFAPLAPLTPRVHLHDNSRQILITELLPAAEDLHQYHTRVRTFPAGIAGLLGKILAQYHGQIGSKCDLAPEARVFPRTPPWILSLHENAPKWFYSLSGGNSQLLGILNTYPDFQQKLDALRAGWRIETFIHGDLRWDNCLLCPNGTGGSEAVLKLVDWEMADFGDPSWDTGAVFACYLMFWIGSLPAAKYEPPARLVERAQYPIEAMQPAMRAFWKAYVDASGLDHTNAAERLERSVSYCAARMIQSAYELADRSAQIGPTELFLLQSSLNILNNPGEAIAHLLEI
jgi:phosphotransferase family enzyme